MPPSTRDRAHRKVRHRAVRSARRALDVFRSPTDVGTIVRASHERWDGSGYPDGLAGEQILIEARIVSTCDAFSAMTTDRSYRRAMPIEHAVAELRRCAGTHFDPKVVAQIEAVLGVPGPAATAEPEPWQVMGPPKLAQPSVAAAVGSDVTGDLR